MSTETRDRIAVRMDQETSQRLEQWYLADNCKSKNEFIVKATNGLISLEKRVHSRREQDWDDDEWQD